MDGPFDQKISLFVARKPYMCGDPAGGEIFDGRGGHKGNVYSEIRNCVYKGSQGPGKINEEIITIMERNTKGKENST